MSDIKIKRALIAVYDKTGIVEFARALVDEFGIEIISTGGTAKHLKDAGIPVTMVEEVTGFPEMLDGRVKTLHPKIHAGILADRDNPDHMRQLAQHDIKPIDMVVVNLYPFEKTVADPTCTLEQAIEMIDIGGPCMLRAAAKNHKHVLVVSDPYYYEECLKFLRTNLACDLRQRMQYAYQVFVDTGEYDNRVETYFSGLLHPDGPECHRKELEKERYRDGNIPRAADWDGVLEAKLRYGENPHQESGLYSSVWDEWDGGIDSVNLLQAKILQGDMSFNNYLDANAAVELCRELTRAQLDEHVVVFIKHTNACGCAIGANETDTYRRAYLSDPISAAGGVLVTNFFITRAFAEMVLGSFQSWGKSAGAGFFKLDVWIAPNFEADAHKLIMAPTEKRKWGSECRLISSGMMDAIPDKFEYDFKKISGGMLVQTRDLIGLNEDQWKVVTKRRPTESEMADLRFAWLVSKHTKSNAISICRDGMLLGNGAGQMSRVKSCDLAIQLSRENGHADKLPGAVAAGDAFFPVPDGPGKLIDAGITAIIHPGGSNRDAETIALCDQHNVAMILTGTRHFKH